MEIVSWALGVGSWQQMEKLSTGPTTKTRGDEDMGHGAHKTPMPSVTRTTARHRGYPHFTDEGTEVQELNYLLKFTEV